MSIASEQDHASGETRTQPLRQIRARRCVLRSDPSQEYLLYTPHAGSIRAPVVVSIHGLAENPHNQAKALLSHCEAHGAVLVAPKFTARQHPGFQRLGRTPGVRADHLLELIIEEIAALTEADCRQIYLCGFSAGAQFAHRYMMARPHRIANCVVASAGWYTFPDASRKYPYGIRPTRNLPDIRFDPEEFLRVPATILVGERDVQSKNLRRGERINAQQGNNRVERAERWVAAMQEAAVRFGLEPRTKLQLVPNADHSFTQLMKRGNLADWIFDGFFKKRRSAGLNGGIDGAAT